MAMTGDQRHLNAKASITDIAAEVEIDRKETARKLAHTHGMSTKMSMPLFARICSSERSRLGG